MRNQTRRSRQCRGSRPRNYERTLQRVSSAYYQGQMDKAAQDLRVFQQINPSDYRRPTPQDRRNAFKNTQLPWLRKMARTARFG